MKITLVSHASLLVETRGVKILTDPWYEGQIYNNAWELCPPPVARPRFEELDALFISHAHPDHFEARTLERIIAARGPDLPVFIAMFFHDGIKQELHRLGFRRVTEMVPGREFSPFDGVRFYSQQFRLDDSLLVIAGDETLVNINDTPLRGKALVDLGRRYRPDYVAAQFAIAQGYPYCYEGITPDFTREDLVKRFDSFYHVLRPKHMIPFASFVRFCNVDNAHMNAHKMGLDELRRLSAAKLTILYPGDSIERGSVSSDPAHKTRYDAAQGDATARTERRTISIDELTKEVESFTKRLAARAPRALLAKIPPFAFVPTDQRVGFRIDRHGVKVLDVAVVDRDPIRYRLASEVILDAVRHDWGWSDLSIGARFRARVQPGLEGNELWFWIIPMLAGEGYLRFWTLWFLKPRSIRVLWGRRLEIFDYIASLMRGRFMSQIVRKKTDTLIADQANLGAD
jgi:UDP-MurNAc hydroxylase